MAFGAAATGVKTTARVGQIIAFCLLIAGILRFCGQHAPTDASASIGSLFRQLHERGQFNGEALVAKRGEIVYRGSFGVSDRSSGSLFTPDTPSCLASVSKPLTALAVMMLAEKSRLGYDDPIAKYLPELQKAVGAATVRQLLNHTSGIPDYSDLNVEHPGVANAEILDALRKVDRPLFSPGAKYQYSNSGYVLLGLIVERVSGQPLSAYLREHVFGPLNMKDSFVLTSADQKTGRVAKGYNAFGTPDDYDAYITGDGGVYSTVNDLFALDQALNTGKLINPKTLDEAFTPGPVREGRTTYGFGWNVNSDFSGKRVWHTGNTGGFRAFIERSLDEKITVIMLTDGGDTRRVEIDRAIRHVLAGQPYDLPKKSIAVAMHDVVMKSGVEAALEVYRRYKTSHADDYDLGEGEINTLGYQLLYGDHRQEDALKIFLLNTTEHSSSSNAFDSLAEAFDVTGDKTSARRYYGVALRKDPQNLHARSMLQKLE